MFRLTAFIFVYFTTFTSFLQADEELAPLINETCIELLRRFGIEPEHLWVKVRQLPHLETIFVAEQIREQRIEAFAENPKLYPHTAKLPRQYEWPSPLLKLLKNYTGMSHPLGTQYNGTHTRFRVMGDNQKVSKIEILIFDKPNSTEPIQTKSMTQVENEAHIWEGLMEGNFEGRWYQYRYHFKNRSVHLAVDPAAHLVLPDKAMVYYPPALTARARRPDQRSHVETLELHIGDLNAPDLKPTGQFRFSTLTKSPYVHKIVSSYPEVELMPFHAQTLYDTYHSGGKRVLYGHHWGYQIEHFSPALEKGGVDEFIFVVDQLHRKGIRIRMDQVMQHTANPDHRNRNLLFVFKEALTDAYNKYDCRTGCGNTLNTVRGSSFYRFMMQKLITDAGLYKVDAWRFDLMGAMRGEAVADIVELAGKLNVSVSGEPWAAFALPYFDPGGFPKVSWWPMEEGKIRLIKMLHHGGRVEEFLPLLNSYQETSKFASHDDIPLSVRAGNDPKKIAAMIALINSSFGNTLTTLSDVVGHRGNSTKYPKLNDTPTTIDPKHLSPEQKNLMEYILEAARLRKQMSAFFGYQNMQKETGDKVFFVKSDNEGAVGIHIKKPAWPTRSKLTNNRELLVIINLNANGAHLDLPPGTWQTRLESNTLSATSDKPIRIATGKYFIHGQSVVWLIRKKP